MTAPVAATLRAARRYYDDPALTLLAAIDRAAPPGPQPAWSRSCAAGVALAAAAGLRVRRVADTRTSIERWGTAASTQYPDIMRAFTMAIQAEETTK